MSKYLDLALRKLSTLSILLEKPKENPILPLLEQVQHYDAERVMVIASTLQMSSAFNDLVRNNIQGMEISTRYAEIATSFNSIIADLGKMNDWNEDGKFDLNERVQMAWMRVRRGTIPSRFEGIRSTYLDVAKSSNDQIQRESTILEAYQDFRLAYKSAEVAANEVLLRSAEPALAAARKNLEVAGSALDEFKRQADEAAKLASERGEAYAGDDTAERARLELVRDEALRAVEKEKKDYEFVRKMADMLLTGYNTSELVFARFQQNHGVKRSLYESGVVFFATNETVFTGQAATFTQQAGMVEATNAHEAMKQGLSDGLEQLAKGGTTALENATRAAYGPTIRVSSVKALADSVVQWQESSLKLIDDLQKESADSAAQIAALTEDGKQRYAALINKGA